MLNYDGLESISSVTSIRKDSNQYKTDLTYMLKNCS